MESLTRVNPPQGWPGSEILRLYGKCFSHDNVQHPFVLPSYAQPFHIIAFVSHEEENMCILESAEANLVSNKQRDYS